MPNERAPWTSCYSLAKEKRAWKEGASSSQGEKKREREEGGNSLDTLRVDVRERDRLGERARPLNLEQSGRAISARTRRPVSPPSSVSAIELLTDSHRKRVRFAQQRRV